MTSIMKLYGFKENFRLVRPNNKDTKIIFFKITTSLLKFTTKFILTVFAYNVHQMNPN